MQEPNCSSREVVTHDDYDEYYEKPQHDPRIIDRSNNNDNDDDKEEERTKQLVDALYRDDKLFEAVRVLKKQSSSSSSSAAEEGKSSEWKKEYQNLIDLVEESERMIQMMKDIIKDDDSDDDGDDPSKKKKKKKKKDRKNGWKHVVKNENNNDANNNNNNDGGLKSDKGKTNMWSRGNEEHTELELSITTPIQESLLVPLLSVLNESQLYHTWLPSWNLPPIKFGIKRVEKLQQIGRCSQVILVTFDPPWPLSTREVVLRAVAMDDIDHTGTIFVKLDSLSEDDDVVPPPDNDKVVRLFFNGGILFSKNHPNDILLQFYGHVASHISVPTWFYEFIVKVFIQTCWNLFLKVAIGVKHGKRKEHCQAIEQKWTDLYEWIQTRTAHMMLSSSSSQPTTTT